MTRLLTFTSQQSAILDAAGVSVAVSAGAGCGKTFVLTQRFLAFLRSAADRPDPLSSIVAITFTEKAAREMRHRVRQACQQELISCDSAHVDHWLNVLRGLDTARISTIHAFCSTLLRRFAVEAGLDPAFGLLETSFGDTFARRSVREGLCGLLEARDPDAMQFVVRYGFEGASTKIRELLYGVQLADADEFDKHTPESLVELWKSRFVEECVPRLMADFWESPAALRTLGLLQEHEPSHAAMRQRRAVLMDLLGRRPTDDIQNALKAIREHAQVQGGGGKSAWLDEEVYEEIKTAFTSLRKDIDGLSEKISAIDDDPTEAAALALVAHRVVRAVADHHARRKDDESRLDFDDLLCRSRDLLLRNPGVRRRASAGIDLLMVDEFQDTDPVQAELVRLLCGEALATGRLFLVGDSKQSIYRFRRADPRVFAALRNELPEVGRLPLTTNFRSQPAILRFVNYVFGSEIEDYEPLEPADPIQRSPEPSVEFLFRRAEDKSEGAEIRRRQEAKWIAGRIGQLLADETPRVIDPESKQLRRMQPGDIAILFRTLSNVHLYEQALIAADLDYYLAGGRAFFAQQEIHDIVHLCRWLDDPSDELSLVGVLRSPFFGLDDDTIFLLKPDRIRPLAEGLENPPKLSEIQAEQVRRASAILSELTAKKDRLPLAGLLTLAIERTGYDAALLCEHLGERKLANLRKLIGLARAYDSGGPFTLSEFAARLREAVSEQADEEMAVTHPEVGNVIRLMTIHQAKGLEFPVVIVADMDWRRPGGDSGAYYHPQLGPLFSMPNDEEDDRTHLGKLIHRLDEAREEEAEQVRLLYVAVTRAKDHLILSAGLDPDGKPRSSWLKLLARRLDLLTGLPAHEPYFGSAGGTVLPSDTLPDVLVHHEEPAAKASHRRSRRNREPLREFRKLVADAVPEPLPPLLGAIPADGSGRRVWTVTELCEADRISRERGRSKSKTSGNSQSPSQGLLFEEEEQALAPSNRGYAQLLGTVCHTVLERLDFSDADATSPATLARMVDQSLLSMTGTADSRLRNVVLRKMKAFASSSLHQELRKANQIHKEIEFRLRWTGNDGLGEPVEIVGAIDCLFEDSKRRWHLIDYKTVEEAGHDAASLIKCYELQIAIYAIAVEQFFGRPAATARIARLGTKTTLLTIPLTSETTSDAAQRIDAALRLLRSG